MSEGTAIEWADDSWNPFRAHNRATGKDGHYCVKISPGCKNCYAERLQTWPLASGIRYAAQDLEPGGPVVPYVDENAMELPLRLKGSRDIFPCSMTDLFLGAYPDDWIGQVFDVMYQCPQHRFLVLTKRPERMVDFIVGRHGAGNNVFAYKNVWFGISAENQDEWDTRGPYISGMTALGFNTWASFEPLLSEINLRLSRVHWAVIGGESGPGARPTVIGHVRNLLRHLQYLRIAAFVKQLGAKAINREGERHPLKDKKGGDMAEWPEDLRVRQVAPSPA